MSDLSIQPLQLSDPGLISSAFTAIGWKKPAEQYIRYLEQQEAGARNVLVGRLNGEFAGYATIRWMPDYPPFALDRIPAIEDLNVLPVYRRRGVATALLDQAEELIGERSSVAGIGVGMDPDYGPAQRLYVLRGYVPDGRGLSYRNRFVAYGDRVRVDDGLVLHLVKHLA